MTRASGTRQRVAFTLIELLVVIAIIAVLVGILLPGLKKARDSGRMLKCQINMKQIGMASHVYARDYKDRLWTASNWADADPNPNGFTPGLLFDYVDYADFIVECPTNKRANVSGVTGGNNGFGWNRDLNFDYTMIDEIQGAQVGREIHAAYVGPSDPTPAQCPPSVVPRLTMFPALPMFVEESTPVWNQTYTDGYWGNQDQVTLRHDKGGFIAFFDGQVTLFRQRAGRFEETSEPTIEFEANDLYVSTKLSPNSWWKVSDRNQPYGWVNNPRP